MSYLMFSASRLFHLAKFRSSLLFCHPHPKTRDVRTLQSPHLNCSIQHDCTGCTGSVGRYSTSAKPSMTKSLLQWKKRKRKSKAQQQKEMENLQRDLVKLLTKRAIQVVRNKSLLNAHREVVTCHAFDHQSQGSEALVEGSPLSPMYLTEQSRSRGEHKSFYVARAVEAQLNLDQRVDVSQVAPKAREDSVLPNAGLTFNHNTSLEGAKENIPQRRLSLAQYKPIKCSELFQTSLSMPPKKSTQHEPDFHSAFKSFSSELSTINKGTAPSPRQDWDYEVCPQDSPTQDSPPSPKPLLSFTTKDIEPNVLVPHKIQTKSSLSKETRLHKSSNDSYPESPDLRDISLSPSKGFELDITSERASVPSIGTSFSSLFIHDPIDEPEDEFLDSHEHHKPAASKKKLTTNKKDAYKTHLGGANPMESINVSSLEGSPENFYAKVEKVEMLERSYVEASCFAGCELLVIRNLQYHAATPKLTSVHVYNLLMHARAKKGDLQTIKSLFLSLRQQGLEPTMQTYAACLECIGRMSNIDVELCKNIVADMRRANLDPADIARKCIFRLDELDCALKAIRLVDPDFKLNPMTFRTGYDNKLLLGLNTVNEQALEKNQYAVDFSHQEMMERANMQLEMEIKGVTKVESIASADLREKSNRRRMELRNNLLAEWRKVLLSSFDQKVAIFEKGAKDNMNMTMYPFLKLFPREGYVNVIFQSLRDLLTMSAAYSPTLFRIKNELGSAVNLKFNVSQLVSGGIDKKIMVVYEHFMKEFLDDTKRLDNHRLMWKRAMCQNPATMNMDMSLNRWPRHIRTEIGAFLLDMIFNDLKVDANLFKTKAPKRSVPAFYSMVSQENFQTKAELKIHPVLSRLFTTDDSEFFSFTPSEVPMLVPPVPWTSRNTGSLLLGSGPIVRLRQHMVILDPLKSVKESRYLAVLDSLNTLSACAWKINKPVLDLQIEIFNNKGNAKLKVSIPASEFPPLPVIKKDMTTREKSDLYRERLRLQQQRQDAHGLWCTELYRLSIAKKFRDEVFWFPHSMDFRGRSYPLPPHFNHLGSDNIRGMLIFAKGKPLGEKGYDWLKIHLINLTGLRKRSSNADRLQYANAVMEDILDSADKPLTGKKWWQESDEPWQTLACCMEIAKVERFEGNKADYVSHFPVHQDGSCNGLQHYAALGRDQSGAESVNLHPFEVPKDVYSNVVDLVEKTRQKDAAEGNKTAQFLEGFVKRKVIKQTIMTTVYGVTKFGARQQIHRQLKDMAEFSKDDGWNGSMYLTKTTFICLREMFTAAKDIQDWLSEASRLISTFAPVEWVTPLGFPVLQPYFKRSTKKSKCFFKFKPNTLKQKNAFPPNYIHSLDSTHMMLTALYCVHAGITFVSVHDCFWTHACDVPVMNRICREQFVNMHKQPLLEDLSKHLIDLLNRAAKDPILVENLTEASSSKLLQLLQNVPKRGSFDLDNVLKSTYFFS